MGGVVKQYPARYRDSQGEEATAIRDDGHAFAVTLRGVEFRGPHLPCLGPTDPSAADAAGLTLVDGRLGRCTIGGDIGVQVATPEGEIAGLLTFQLHLSRGTAFGGIDRDRLQLRLVFGGVVAESSRTHGDFDGELRDLHQRLPAGASMVCCWTCALGDYSVYGDGLFGDLKCFLPNRAEYLKVALAAEFEKHDYLDAMNGTDVWVRETHRCPSHEPRTPGMGYRG